VYRPVDSSTQGLPDYSEALIQGASALRVLQGLAPFGRPMAPVGLDDGIPEDGPVPSAGPTPTAGADSCMLTTGHSLL
jgi:hypothetical protein